MKGIDNKLIVDGNIRERLEYISQKKDNITAVYGHFNVIHPGHLRFLRNAQEIGKYLLVMIRSDSDLLDDTSEQFFTQEERAQGVAALHGVDAVVVLDKISFEEVIEILKPNSFVLGKEFETHQDHKVKSYINTISHYGGKTYFRSGDVKYASTDLLFHSEEEIQTSKLNLFQKTCLKHNIDLQDLQNKLDDFSKVNILVVGDTIVDQYVACDALGMSAEAPVIAIRELETKEFIGGAAIVASHIKTIGANCHYLSVIGDDQPGVFVEEQLNSLGVKPSLLKDPKRPTTFKIRYMVNNQKMLRVSRLQDHSINKDLENALLKEVENMIAELDGIVLCDFVYGVITKRVLEKIVDMANANDVMLFGDLQCSSQVGNVCKFKTFDLITPTEREARIAISDHESGLENLAHTILDDTQSKNLLITLSSNGFIAYHKVKNSVMTKSQHFPALNSNPVDVAGAGDTLLATMAVGLSSGLNLLETSALGTCSAAVAVGRLGNIPIKQLELKNYLQNLTRRMESVI